MCAGGAGVVGCVSTRECVRVFPSPQGTATFHRLARKRPQANAVSYGERVYFQHNALQLVKLSDEVMTLRGKLQLFLQNVASIFKVLDGNIFSAHALSRPSLTTTKQQRKISQDIF